MSDYAKIELDYGVLRELDKAAIRALEKTAEAVHTEVVQAQVIPRDTGHMQNDQTFADITRSAEGHVEIVTSAPQARRLYYHPEYNFQTLENPNAKGKWFEDWEHGGEKGRFAPEAFGKFYKREAGL